ncbi:MAG: hypothetical protein BWY06_01437 [Candidatus Latescibacteria bacterium ADurb.Bin168]|nr:MAG: hypothetical protein BWY06_01437 [Candidatus Latescibacteria bacterium ADurb.Bin168]
MLMTSSDHPLDSAYREYMRKRSAANNAASSPPVPPRISRIVFLSSFGSLGISCSLSVSSRVATRSSRTAISSFAKAMRSRSCSSSKIRRASASWASTSAYRRPVSTIGASCRCSFASFWYWAISAVAAGSERSRSISVNRVSMAARRSNISLFLPLYHSGGATYRATGLLWKTDGCAHSGNSD